MSNGCLTELELFAAFRGDSFEGDVESALRHVLDCRLCHEQWKRFAVDEQVAAGLRSALHGDARGADEVPGLREAMKLPELIEIPGFRIREGYIEGGQARVFRAVHEASQEEVAIKVFHHSPLNEPGNARFFRELKSLTLFRHPHVIPIRSEGEVYGHAYLVMPWIEGSPLNEYVKHHKLTVRQKVRMLAKICSALDHAHKRGVMHLDLKPTNVRVDSKGEPVVLDFALARLRGDILDDAGLGLAVAGTPPYMAPEQVQDPNNLDIRSDVYTLGLLLYEMLCGRRAKGSDPGEGDRARWEVALEQPVPLRKVAPAIGAELAAIVEKAIAPDRGDRYRSAEAMQADLERFLAGRAVEALAGHVVYQARKFARQHLAGTVGLAAIALILVSGMYMRYQMDCVVGDAEQFVIKREEQLREAAKYAPPRPYLYNLVADVYKKLSGVCAELGEAYALMGEDNLASHYRRQADENASKADQFRRPETLVTTPAAENNP